MIRELLLYDCAQGTHFIFFSKNESGNIDGSVVSYFEEQCSCCDFHEMNSCRKKSLSNIELELAGETRCRDYQSHQRKISFFCETSYLDGIAFATEHKRVNNYRDLRCNKLHSFHTWKSFSAVVDKMGFQVSPKLSYN